MCRPAVRAEQFSRWYHNRDEKIKKEARTKAYEKRAEANRQYAQERRLANPEYHALSEWYRKKGVSLRDVGKGTIAQMADAMRELKKSKKLQEELSHELRAKNSGKGHITVEGAEQRCSTGIDSPVGD